MKEHADIFANANRIGTGSMKQMRFGPDILPLWVADMDFPAPPALVAALHERVEHGVFGYTLPTDELLETCCAYFKRRWNWQVEPEWLVMSPGLGVALHTTARYLGDTNLGLLTPQPIYHIFRQAAPRAKRKRIDVMMERDGDNWVLSPDSIEAAAKQAGGAGVLMLCSPHNPNGKVFTKAELEALAELALRNDWVICADEVHADLILDEDKPHIPIASLGPEVAAKCVTLQSPSKAFNVAGLNFAVCVISDPDLREKYKYGASGQVISQLNPLGMVAGRSAWGGDCDKWLEDCIRHLRANRDLISETVASIDGITMPHLCSTYLAWLDVSELGLADPPAHFESHGLGMSPGATFGDANYMRLNFGCDRDTVVKACELLRKAASAI